MLLIINLWPIYINPYKLTKIKSQHVYLMEKLHSFFLHDKENEHFMMRKKKKNKKNDTGTGLNQRIFTIHTDTYRYSCG